MNTPEYILLVATLSLSFSLYVHRKEVKNLFVWVLNIIPLFMSGLMILTGVAAFILAPLAFSKQEVNGLDYAYGIFFVFLLLAIISIPLAKFYYKDYKNPIVF